MRLTNVVRSPHVRGHLLQFDGRSLSALSRRDGIRLLLTAALLEGVRLAVSFSFQAFPRWMFLPLLLGFALLAVAEIAGVRLSRIGLIPWRDWSVTEKSYLLQVVIIAVIVFQLQLGAGLAARAARVGVAWHLWSVFVPYLFYGFYQELTYRGMLQTELVRSWGPAAGIVVANLLYTFGPLHWYYFASRLSFAAPMFASIFLMGLWFGVVYHRSGNLWLPAIFHAIGNAYIVSSVGPIR